MAKCLAVEWVDFARVDCISPGFIQTDMLDVHPKEHRDLWMQLVPAKRTCDASELKGVRVALIHCPLSLLALGWRILATSAAGRGLG